MSFFKYEYKDTEGKDQTITMIEQMDLLVEVYEAASRKANAQQTTYHILREACVTTDDWKRLLKLPQSEFKKLSDLYNDN